MTQQATAPGPLPPPTGPLVPTQIVVGASSGTWFNQVKEWAHQAAAVIGLLMVIYTGIVANIPGGTPNIWAGVIGASVVMASKAIDSYSFTNLNAPVGGQ